MRSSEFYDNFIEYQIKTGINDRIYNLYKRIRKMGLPSTSNILELGCGIGSLTYLISRKVKLGKIEAIDISQKSIEYAKANLVQPNLLFSNSDILDFKPVFSNFDKILLFDVLEHVPEESHAFLFNKISQWMKVSTELLVNVPNPSYVLFDQKFNPRALQEIDQPIFIHRLAKDLANAFLHIEFLETYSVWVKNDYQFLVIKKDTEFSEYSLSSDRNIFEKIKVRLDRNLRRYIFRYPSKKNSPKTRF
jgi:trans-aconitate 2-methyltransferase